VCVCVCARAHVCVCKYIYHVKGNNCGLRTHYEDLERIDVYHTYSVTSSNIQCHIINNRGLRTHYEDLERFDSAKGLVLAVDGVEVDAR